MTRNEVAKKITLVPQDTFVDFPFRAREIVAMGRTPYLGRFRPEGVADKAAIKYALEVTETECFAERPVTELSGGERQRIILARAIAQETRIMLLDEPTSNLDVGHQLQVLGLIRSLARQGRCALAALHDLSLAARFCDRILLLSNGALVADSTASEVMTEENLARYFGISVQIKRDEKNGELIIWPLAPIKKTSEGVS
jgi:iron complex transport system ATP-binding protein